MATEENAVTIQTIDPSLPAWEETIRFADGCSWEAGPRLAELMRRNDFEDWERVVNARDGDRLIGFCTFERTGRMPKKLDFRPFINYVFVDERYRGNRISERMIRFVLAYAETLGYETVYLKSAHRGFYEKYGFEKMCDFEPVQGAADQLFRIAV